MWETIPDFIHWLGAAVFLPLIRMMDSVKILGFTFFEWFVGIAVVSLAVHFVSYFWGSPSAKD